MLSMHNCYATMDGNNQILDASLHHVSQPQLKKAKSGISVNQAKTCNIPVLGYVHTAGKDGPNLTFLPICGSYLMFL